MNTKKILLKFANWYDQNYGMSLFTPKDLEPIIDQYLQKENRISEEVFEIILNDLSARKGGYLLRVTDERRRMIKKRIQEGYEINDFIEVNRCMCEKWKNKADMKDYLTPETLYSAKFTKYREMADELGEVAVNRIRTTTENALREIRR